MQEYLEYFNNRIVITVMILFGIGLLKAVLIKTIKKINKEKDRRHTINVIKNVIHVITIIILFLLWGGEIQEFAISIAAFTVGIIIAGKEIIQCFIGFLYISSSRTFRIGDWIKSGDFTGEVIETDWAKTTMMEVDPLNYSFTGRTIFIPNSQLLLLPINNLNFMRRYVHLEFDIVKDDKEVNPFKVKELLSVKINERIEDFAIVAERYNNMIENRLGVKINGSEPVIRISTTSQGKIRFHINIFCPTEKVHQIEQEITEDFFAIWLNEKK
jgi:small-conductance mechanosensitive channel